MILLHFILQQLILMDFFIRQGAHTYLGFFFSLVSSLSSHTHTQVQCFGLVLLGLWNMGLSYQSCGCVSKLRLNTGLSHMLTLTHPLSHTQRGFMRRARTPLSACLQSTTDSVRIQERVSRNGSESESEGGERIFRRVCVLRSDSKCHWYFCVLSHTLNFPHCPEVHHKFFQSLLYIIS